MLEFQHCQNKDHPIVYLCKSLIKNVNETLITGNQKSILCSLKFKFIEAILGSDLFYQLVIVL